MNIDFNICTFLKSWLLVLIGYAEMFVINNVSEPKLCRDVAKVPLKWFHCDTRAGFCKKNLSQIKISIGQLVCKFQTSTNKLIRESVLGNCCKCSNPSKRQPGATINWMVFWYSGFKIYLGKNGIRMEKRTREQGAITFYIIKISTESL